MTKLNELRELVQDQNQIIQKQQKDFKERLQKQQEIATSISNEKGKKK